MASLWDALKQGSEDWDKPAATDHLLGRTKEGRKDRLPATAWRESLRRVSNLRSELRGAFVGLDDVVDWLLATVIARENGLLLGAPGVAKSQMVTRLFDLLGLRPPPQPDPQVLAKMEPGPGRDMRTAWTQRCEEERKTQKQFHYLLSRFTQPEELFGPIEIDMLKKGVLVRVNFGLLTGPGVRAGFLDEVFKASSNILNTLLTLTQERQYFNWGGMEESDLLFLIGASNELPGAFGGAAGVVGTLEDFQQMYAFLDRFPLRLEVPIASGGSESGPAGSDLGKAFKVAVDREANHFTSGAAFRPPTLDMPCINDIICLGRSMMEAREEIEHGTGIGEMFARRQMEDFTAKFIKAGCMLQAAGVTNVSTGALSWSISPRKLRSLYKIALAHSLVVGGNHCLANNAAGVKIGPAQLRVFIWIWDSPAAKGGLRPIVDQLVND